MLLLFTTSQIGGAERSLTRMALHSPGTLYELATLGGEGPWTNWIRQLGRSPVIFGPSPYIAEKILGGSIWRVVGYCRKNRIDLIYVCGVRASLALRLLQPFLGAVKVVHGVRSNPGSSHWFDRYVRFVEKYTGWLLAGWVVNSQATADTLIERCGVDPQRVAVIHNGFEVLPSGPRSDSTRVELLTVANYSHRKGILPYVEKVGALLTTERGVKVVLVGRDDLAGQVQKKVKDLGLGGVVNCVGYSDQVEYWYKRANVFVLPSLWGEGCPTAILEAFAHGLPVVAYAIDGVSELVDDGKNGLLVSPGDYRGLLAAIQTLLDDQELAKAMGETGRRRVARDFSITRCSSIHLDFWGKLTVQPVGN